MDDADRKLVIFNVRQSSVQRCINASETGLRAKTPPPYLKEGTLCFLRQTSLGADPKNYGVVGIYRIDVVQKHDPVAPISGWTPQTGWGYHSEIKGTIGFALSIQ